MDHEDLPQWRPKILLECGRKGPAMCLTEENLKQLRLFVHAEMQDASPKFPKRRADDKTPRGPPSAKEYFVEGRGWIKRAKSAAPSGSSRPYAQRWSQRTVQGIKEKQARATKSGSSSSAAGSVDADSLNAWYVQTIFRL